MCDYLSFEVTEAGDIRLGTGWSHSGVAAAYGLRAGTYREGEWLDDGTLVVRTEADDDPVEWRERVLARYADRAALESAWQGAETRAVLNERGEVGTFVVRPPEVAMVGPRRVGGDLDLCGCTGLTALPDGLRVGGNLDLCGCTGLTALPDGLRVGGDLYLGGCTGLTALPDGLSVGGDLYLCGCTGLTALPDGLRVGGDLYLGGCTGELIADAKVKGLRYYC